MVVIRLLRRLFCSHRAESYIGLMQLPDSFHIAMMCDRCRRVDIGRGAIRQPAMSEPWQDMAERMPRC